MQGGAPPSYKLVYKPMNAIDLSPTKTKVIGVINQLMVWVCFMWIHPTSMGMFHGIYPLVN